MSVIIQKEESNKGIAKSKYETNKKLRYNNRKKIRRQHMIQVNKRQKKNEEGQKRMYHKNNLKYKKTKQKFKRK